MNLAQFLEPDQAARDRRDAWVTGHPGWKITHTWGLPGWWKATLNGEQVARYNDLGDLMDRLEASWGSDDQAH